LFSELSCFISLGTNTTATHGTKNDAEVFSISSIILHLLGRNCKLTDAYGVSIIHTFLVCRSFRKVGLGNDAHLYYINPIPQFCSMLQFTFKGSVLISMRHKDTFTLLDADYLSLIAYKNNVISPFAIVCSISRLAKQFRDVNIKSTVEFGINPTTGRIDTNIYCIGKDSIHFDKFVSCTNNLLCDLKESMDRCWMNSHIETDSLIHLVWDDVRSTVSFLVSYLVLLF